LRDLNKYSKETNRRIVIGALILIFLVGDGLIYLIYGSQSALLGLFCLLLGLLPVLLIIIVIIIIDWILKRANRE